MLVIHSPQNRNVALLCNETASWKIAQNWKFFTMRYLALFVLHCIALHFHCIQFNLHFVSFPYVSLFNSALLLVAFLKFWLHNTAVAGIHPCFALHCIIDFQCIHNVALLWLHNAAAGRESSFLLFQCIAMHLHTWPLLFSSSSLSSALSS